MTLPFFPTVSSAPWGQRLSDLSHFPSQNLVGMNEQLEFPQNIYIWRESCPLKGVFFKEKIVDGKGNDISMLGGR